MEINDENYICKYWIEYDDDAEYIEDGFCYGIYAGNRDYYGEWDTEMVDSFNNLAEAKYALIHKYVTKVDKEYFIND